MSGEVRHAGRESNSDVASPQKPPFSPPSFLFPRPPPFPPHTDPNNNRRSQKSSGVGVNFQRLRLSLGKAEGERTVSQRPPTTT